MAQHKEKDDQHSRIISTKVSPKQHEQLDDFCKRRGFGSLYEFMQYIFFVMLKYDDMEHGAEDDNEDQINDFLRPFLEVEKPIDYLIAARKDAGNYKGCYSRSQRGDIKFIVVRDGDFIAQYHKEGDELKVSHNADDAALSIALAGRPDLKESLKAVMSANKIGSFLECLRILVNDALPDARIALRNDAQSYAANIYGEVPVKTHGKVAECINPYLLKGKHKRNADHLCGNGGADEDEEY